MIAKFLFDNPRLLWLTIGTIIVAGLTSLSVMPRLEDPVLRQRVGVVSTVYPGADAQKVESLVTIPIEEALTRIAKIKQVRSNSRTGISNIVIELEDAVNNVEEVWSLVRSQVADLETILPKTAAEPEVEVFPLKAYAAIVAIKAQGKVDDLSISRRLVQVLRSRVLAIEGTEEVDVFGDPGEELVAEIKPVNLIALQTSIAAIAQQVGQSLSEQPGGELRDSSAITPIELASEWIPEVRVGNVLVSHGMQGESIPLSEVANVSKRLADPVSSLALIDGEPAIVLGAMVDNDQQIDRWSDRLNEVLLDFEANYSRTVRSKILFLQREHVDQRMETLLRNLLMGTGAVVLVVFLLMGWRSMLVVGLALPLSALMVIVGMRAFAIPIHQMSVTGLIVALGLLIDNAIVIVEEVRAKILTRIEPRTAVTQSVSHLAMPLLGSTVTTALAFLPIATLSGPSGEFVGSIAVSVILAISASFFLAMTVIPATFACLRVQPDRRGFLSYGLKVPPIQRAYEFSLQLVFRLPLLGVLLGLVFPVLGFMAGSQLQQQFFPPSDRNQIQIEVERPARDSIGSVGKTVDAIRAIVAQNEAIKSQQWFLGGSAPTFFYNVVPRRRGTPFYAQAFVDLEANVDSAALVRSLQDSIDRQVHDSRVIVRQLEQGPPFDAPIEVRLVGPDLEVLQELGSQLRLLMSQTADVIHTRSDLEETIPNLSLDFDTKLLSKSGLNQSQVAGQIYTTLEGASAGEIFDGGEALPVKIKLDLSDDSQLDLLSSLPLVSNQRRGLQGTRGSNPGKPSLERFSHPSVASLADFELESDVGAVIRVDGRRVNEVKAYLRAGVLTSKVLEAFKTRLEASEFVLPRGYDLEFGGESEKRTQAVDSLIANAVVLTALMVLTLVTSFRSFRCAIVIAIVGGLSIGLGPLALSTFGFPFGFMAIVGTMGLVGVAINDSIVVLAAIRANPKAKQGNADELVDVVSGCTRHILATTLTTIVGFTPLVVGRGEFWPPLAITIAGGVGGATLLALYFVPSLHLLLHGRGVTDPETSTNNSLQIAKDKSR